MSVDLDELFGALRHQADAIPLPDSEPARQRGRHRERVRTAMTVALAITLVAVGVGVAAGQPWHRATQPASRNWPPVPSVGPPVRLTTPATAAKVVTDGTRAYTAWVAAPDDTVWLTATDLRTGAQVWAPRKVGTGFALDEVVVEPSAVVVLTRKGTGYHMSAFYPPTGTARWSLDGPNADDVVFAANKVFVLKSLGEVSMKDISTGNDVGGVTFGYPAYDEYVRIVGTATAADENGIGRSGTPANFADLHVAVVSQHGRVYVMNAHTGTGPPMIKFGTSEPEDLVAIDGWLVTHDTGSPRHIRATDLTGKAGTRDFGTVPGDFVTFGRCGTGRVCVVSRGADGRTETTAFDLARGRPVWQARGKVDGDRLSSASGYTMVATADGRFDLFNARGKRTFTSTLPGGGWLDPTHLLINDPDGSGRLARLSITDRKLTALGQAPAGTLGCASTSTELICAGATTVITYRVN